jgi:hypothetical protein
MKLTHFFAASCVLFCAGSGLAQTPDIGAALAGANQACVLNHPVTAQLAMTYKIAKPDGTFISFGLAGDMQRDSDGRTEVTIGMPKPGESGTVLMTFVLDPVRQRNLIWTSDSKVVNASDAKFPPCSATVPSNDLKSHQVPKGSTLIALSDKTISGYVASGFLLTTTVPGGADASSNLTTEFWISKELGIPLEFKFAGKSFGEMQMEFSDIRTVEPPAGRFQIPEGYTVLSEPQAK